MAQIRLTFKKFITFGLDFGCAAMSRHLFLLLPLLVTAFATAREHPENWIEVRSSRFTIVTNSSEKQGRRIAAQFERMRAIFQQAYPQLEDHPESPVWYWPSRTKISSARLNQPHIFPGPRYRGTECSYAPRTTSEPP
jgi:hypothetical protein